MGIVALSHLLNTLTTLHLKWQACMSAREDVVLSSTGHVVEGSPQQWITDSLDLPYESPKCIWNCFQQSQCFGFWMELCGAVKIFLPQAKLMLTSLEPRMFTCAQCSGIAIYSRLGANLHLIWFI